MNDLITILLFVFFGCILGYLMTATFYFHSPQYADATKADCINKGFYNLDLNEKNKTLQAELSQCQERLALTKYSYDKNILVTGILLEECERLCYE